MNTDYPSPRQQVDVWPGLHDNDIEKHNEIWFINNISGCNQFNLYN